MPDHQKLNDVLDIITTIEKQVSRTDFSHFVFLLGSLIVRKITRQLFIKKMGETSDIIELCTLVHDPSFAYKLLPFLAEFTIEKHNHCDYIAKMFIMLLKSKLDNPNTVLLLLRDYKLEENQVQDIYNQIKSSNELVESFKAFVPYECVHILNQ